MCVCVCAYHDFVCVALLSVIKGQVSSVVENQLHSLWRPSCPQHPETQSTRHLACCHTGLNTHTNTHKYTHRHVIQMWTPFIFDVNTEKGKKCTPPLAPWMRTVSPALAWALQHTTYQEKHKLFRTCD